MVRVESRYGTGSGVAVTERHVLTCKHVVAEPKKPPFAKGPPSERPKVAGKPFDVLWNEDCSLDAVLLCAPAGGLTPIKLPQSQLLETLLRFGDVAAFGIVTRRARHWRLKLLDDGQDGDTATSFRADVGVAEGASGGPLVAAHRGVEYLIGLNVLGGRQAGRSVFDALGALDPILRDVVPEAQRSAGREYDVQAKASKRVPRALEAQLRAHPDQCSAIVDVLRRAGVSGPLDDAAQLVAALMKGPLELQEQLMLAIKKACEAGSADPTSLLGWLLPAITESRWVSRREISAASVLLASGAARRADDLRADFVPGLNPGDVQAAGVVVLVPDLERPLLPLSAPDAVARAAEDYAERLVAKRSLEPGERPVDMLKANARAADGALSVGILPREPPPWIFVAEGVLAEGAKTMDNIEVLVPGVRTAALRRPTGDVGDRDRAVAQHVRDLVLTRKEK